MNDSIGGRWKRDVAPGEGERNALRGYAAQLKVAAARILGAFEDGVLEAVAVADPDVGRVDDLQLLTRRPEGVRVDGFQVKWSGTSKPLADAEFRRLVSDGIAGRKLLQQVWAERRGAGEPSVQRLVVHVHTNRPVSTATLRGDACRGKSLTLPRFLSEVWRPAQHGAITTLEAVAEEWRQYVEQLATEARVPVTELLATAPDLEFEFNAQLPEDAVLRGVTSVQFLRDVRAFVLGLLDAVTDERKLVVLDAGAFLDLVGEEWAERFRPRSAHTFPVPADYQPIVETTKALTGALSRFEQGYVIVTGSPGSGKSTLLTRELLGSPRLAARYYAFVPGDDTATRGEAHALLHDLLLALDHRERLRTLAPPRDQLEQLRQRLRGRLEELGRESRARGSASVILIDGLDHVMRDPSPQLSLLNELLPATDVPQGVLIVIGTRSVQDLPAHLQAESRLPGRHIRMAPLERRATLTITIGAGLAAGTGERIWELSEGHPLLVRTFTALAQGASARELEILDTVPQVDGEAVRYYESVWGELQDDHDLVAVLGLVCRLRGPIDLDWLEAGGTDPGTIEQLSRLEHLFRTSSGSRWQFFHDSFREFLVDRTATRLGAIDVAKERRFHAELARRCAGTPSDSPQAWEELHHRLRAGDDAGVAKRATPAFFRAQLEALRPSSDVAPDINEAAAALASQHDAIAAVRMCLAAAECNLRGYHQEATGDFVRLLLELGHVDLSLAHLRCMSDHTVGNDRTSTALELVVELFHRGLEADAARLFTEFEPLELLGNRGSLRRDRAGVEGPWQRLYAWGAAALLVHGPKYVIEHTATLALTRGDLHFNEDVGEALALLKANVLFAAIRTAADRAMSAAVSELLAALGNDSHGWRVREAVLLDEAAEALRRGDTVTVRRITNRVLKEAEHPIPTSSVILAAELLVGLDRHDDARKIIGNLPGVTLPASGAQEDDDSWWRLLRRLRVEATLAGSLDPVVVFPDSDKDFERSRIVVARHIVGLANLWGRQRRGESVAAGEVVAAVRRLLALWDGASPRGLQDLWSASGGRRAFLEAATVLARDIGPQALRSLWDWWMDRWSSTAHSGEGGLPLVEAFESAGIGPVSLRSRLCAYQTTLEAQLDGGQWTALARIWVRLGEREQAYAAIDRLVSSTFVVGFRKDYQLSTWITLLRPLLHGPSGLLLARWLADRVTELHERAESGASDHAAKALVGIVGETRPAEVLPLARSLHLAGVLDVDDVVEAVLEATAGRASAGWWVVLGEIHVALGAGPARLDAAAAAVDREELKRWLTEVAERVAVEGRPTERRSWRRAMLDIARAHSIEPAEINLTDSELTVDEEAPPPRGQEEKVSEATTPDPVEHLLGKLESGDDQYGVFRSAVERLAELDSDQRARLLVIAADNKDASALYAALAREAEDSRDVDEAWSWGEKAIANSNGHDWRRDWAGGPALQAIRILQRIDGMRARRLVFERFAALASEDDFLLGSIADDLDRAIDIFAPFDEMAVAHEVLDYVVVLSGAPAPASEETYEPSLAEDRADPGEVTDAMCAEVVAWLMNSTHLLAWESAQRAALAMLKAEAAESVLPTLLHEDIDIPPERVLAVLDIALSDGLLDTEAVVPWLRRVAADPRLNVRTAAGQLLQRVGVTPPSPLPREVPAALRLSISKPREVMHGAAAVGAGDLDEMLGYDADELDQLADVAQVDRAALSEYVRAKARRIASPLPADEDLAKHENVLGWGFVRPSAVAVAAGLAEVAAELVDSGRLQASTALTAISAWPVYDTELLRRRPERRPACVPAAADLASRGVSQRDWRDGLAGAELRVATDCEGWLVIGEVTEITLLNGVHPCETREQALVPKDADGTFAPGRRAVRDAQRPRSPRGTESLILRTIPMLLASPDSFLALHPNAAITAGLVPDPADPLAWRLDDEIVVRSLWWRSGFTRWPPYSDRDEVGEGWLVLASPAGLGALLDVYPDAHVTWTVRRTLRPEGTENELERQTGGTRTVNAAVADAIAASSAHP